MRLIMSVAGEAYEIDTQHLMMKEADHLEKYTGWTADQWWQELMKNRVNAVRFAYWLAKERQGDPVDIPFADIDLDMGQIEWKAEADEPVDVEEDDEENPTGSADEGESA